MGSWLDEFYDWARSYTMNYQIALLARPGRLLPWLARFGLSLVFKRERDRAVGAAGGNFQWCKALLAIESSQSVAAIQRFEGDSNCSVHSRWCSCFSS